MAVAKLDRDMKKTDGEDAGLPKFSAARASELRSKGRAMPAAREIVKCDLKEYAETMSILGE